MAYTPLTTEELVEVERRRREDELQRQRASAPKPSPPRSVEQMSLDEYQTRFPPQQITTLHPTPPRDRGGNPPEVDGRSEADKLRDPALLFKRIVALEARVAKLEDILQRQLGRAFTGEGSVYR